MNESGQRMANHCLDTFHAHNARINVLQFGNRSGKVFATGSHDKSVKLFKMDDSTPLLVGRWGEWRRFI